MKKKIRASFGDVILHKFILVPCEPFIGLLDNYREDYGGYFYIWNYTYNKLTKDTDDRNTAHSDMIGSMPAPIRKQARELNIWGKTEYYKDEIRFIIVNGEYTSRSVINSIKRECNVAPDIVARS